MPPNNVLTEWSTLLLGSFADAGVRDVVISPGSRSTPLVVAAVRERRFRLYSVVDERAAAFFALGQARVTGRPSLLVCTSGTAGAHYLPAIIEARATFLPLLVLTADRPPELQDCTASQTIDQVKLFGGNVNHYFDLGTAEASTEVMLAIRRLAAQSVFASAWPTPGPVHLNARIRKPLEPVVAKTPEEHAVVALVRGVASQPITTTAGSVSVPSEPALADAAAMCRLVTRGIIAVGPASAAQVEAREGIFELARATGFPIVCDATSQLRFTRAPEDVVVVDALEELVGSAWFRGGPRPELLVQIGAPLVSAGWEWLAANLAGPRIVLAEHGWSDPQSRAAAMLFGSFALSAAGLARRVRDLGAPPTEVIAWQERLAGANACYWKVCDDTFAEPGPLTEGHVARIVAHVLPEASTWMLGNSLAVRAVNQYCHQGACSATVLSQRGAAGIDGLVAGAAGAASRTEGPVTLLIGDISLLHDLTSLALAQRANQPLVIVILNNGGGRIFEQLPLASAPDLEPEILAQTVTPHALALEHAGKLFGVAWAKADDEASLRNALGSAYAKDGCTVVEACIEDHGNVRIARRVRAQLSEALTA